MEQTRKSALKYFLIVFSIVAASNLSSQEIWLPSGPVEIPVYETYLSSEFHREHLHYVATWQGLRAAEADLWVNPAPERGNDVFHIVGEGRTVGLAARLWKAQATVESYTPTDLRPQEFLSSSQEPTAHVKTHLVFNHEENSAKGLRQELRRDRTKERSFVFRHAYDPVSALYAIRSLEWKVGDRRQFEIIKGYDRWLFTLEAVAYETVTVPAGTFDTVKLAPQLIELPRKAEKETASWFQKLREKMDQEESRLESVELWMARDGARPFVRVWAKGFIGTAKLELESME